MIRKRCKYYVALLRNILLLCIILFIILIYRGTKHHNDEIAASIPKHAYKYIFPIHRNYAAPNTSDIRQYINEYNSQETILNADMYGPVKSDTIILVIYVDKGAQYLKLLILSLSQSKGIQDALVIFSHSYFDENINNLIRNIDFCRVLQIFYPHSVQAYPNAFPGHQANDCPHRLNIDTAEAMNCTGAFTPDIHGRYRHPLNAEKKHHWWWTANKVFENLTCTEDHEGVIMFLQDDIYFVEDFLYMILFMSKAASSFEQCEFLSLGINSLSNINENDTYRVEVTTWDPRYYTNVLAFDISVWNSIATQYDIFCRVDDYSWSRSLFYLSLNRRDGKRYKVMSTLVPRALKINPYGIYEKFIRFDLLYSVYHLLELQNRLKNYLYPPNLEVYTDIELENDEYIIFDYVESNGGWSDLRDKELCSNMTVSKIKKLILDMKNEFDDYIYENN